MNNEIKTKIHKGINASIVEQEERRKEKYIKMGELSKKSRDFSKADFEAGRDWALLGNELDAAGELSKNSSFVKGYANGLRVLIIKQQDYDNGIDYALSGKTLEEAGKLANNEDFLKGYNSVQKSPLKR